jgi:acetyltransferase-like isoleucine patch superfamily enzyme
MMPFSKIYSRVIRFNKNISVGKNFRVTYPCYLETENNGVIVIGNNFSSSQNVTIDASDKGRINIGDNVSFGMNTVLRSSNHDYIKNKGHTPGFIGVGNHVWIGANCAVLKDVKIGSGSVIGAGSVVTKDIPENTVAVGNPCKPIKFINR